VKCAGTRWPGSPSAVTTWPATLSTAQDGRAHAQAAAHLPCELVPPGSGRKLPLARYSDDLRVLEWVLARCNNEVDAGKTAIGWVPKPEDLPMEVLNLPKKNLKKLLEVNKEDWLEDEKNMEASLDMFGPRIPLDLRSQHEGLLRRPDVSG